MAVFSHDPCEKILKNPRNLKTVLKGLIMINMSIIVILLSTINEPFIVKLSHNKPKKPSPECCIYFQSQIKNNNKKGSLPSDPSFYALK